MCIHVLHIYNMSLCGHIYFGNSISYDINVTENLNSCIHQLHRLTNCILKSNKLLKLKEKNSNMIQKHLLHLISAENENHIDVQRLYTCRSVLFASVISRALIIMKNKCMCLNYKTIHYVVGPNIEDEQVVSHYSKQIFQ